MRTSSETCRLLDDDDEYRRMAAIANSGGDGTPPNRSWTVDRVLTGEPPPRGGNGRRLVSPTHMPRPTPHAVRGRPCSLLPSS